MSGVAICKPMSFTPKLFCSILHTIISCKVSARLWQADGELSVMRIVEPWHWTGVITGDGHGILGVGEIYSILGNSWACCGEGINNGCVGTGTFWIIGGELGHGTISCGE